jgi:hypothetical protein
VTAAAATAAAAAAAVTAAVAVGISGISADRPSAAVTAAALLGLAPAAAVVIAAAADASHRPLQAPASAAAPQGPLQTFLHSSRRRRRRRLSQPSGAAAALPAAYPPIPIGRHGPSPPPSNPPHLSPRHARARPHAAAPRAIPASAPPPSCCRPAPARPAIDSPPRRRARPSPARAEPADGRAVLAGRAFLPPPRAFRPSCWPGLRGPTREPGGVLAGPGCGGPGPAPEFGPRRRAGLTRAGPALGAIVLEVAGLFDCILLAAKEINTSDDLCQTVARIDTLLLSQLPDEQAVKSGCRGEAGTHVG